MKKNLISDSANIGNISIIAKESFKKIAPAWPLKNLIAVNPLQGLEDLPIEEALKRSAAYFEQKVLPKGMDAVNRETIKWLQGYFDGGQSTISMPLRKKGLYTAWRKLVIYDSKIHHHDKNKQQWLKALPETAEQAIFICLLELDIEKEDWTQFLTLMLTTLHGWAAYVKYRTEWAEKLDAPHPHPVTQADYLAVRMIVTTLLWPEAKMLLDFYRNAYETGGATICLEKIQSTERAYRTPLLEKISKQPIRPSSISKAQLVFCIDVRSEQFRRSLESTDDYETFGFAGFFGVPIQVIDAITNESYASCPVLLSPKYTVKESPLSRQDCRKDRKRHETLTKLKRIYQSVKYTFTAPFAQVEILGILSGISMALRSLLPRLAYKLERTVIETIRKPQETRPSIDNIPFTEQCAYAEGALRMMGLTHKFSPIVVFCGHGSTSQNNAYATSLDCGACAGRNGASNARTLAAILNRKEVRAKLSSNGITIPEFTCFIAAEHNTTTDSVILYGDQGLPGVQALIKNLKKAEAINSVARLREMEIKTSTSKSTAYTKLRSVDWAQTRPEWGLARNAAFIVAPRDITYELDLEGRCFLHSYDYTQDLNGAILTTMLTAPMVVAHWINMQYLFSTVNNVAYGGGSKITKNITGKIGIMQGNASDLMIGLPLQSVNINDTKAYHESQRLMTAVFAPRHIIERVIHSEPVLKKLFGNGWAALACIEPISRKAYLLNRDFTWKNIH